MPPRHFVASFQNKQHNGNENTYKTFHSHDKRILGIKNETELTCVCVGVATQAMRVEKIFQKTKIYKNTKNVFFSHRMFFFCFFFKKIF